MFTRDAGLVHDRRKQCFSSLRELRRSRHGILLRTPFRNPLQMGSDSRVHPYGFPDCLDLGGFPPHHLALGSWGFRDAGQNLPDPTADKGIVNTRLRTVRPADRSYMGRAANTECSWPGVWSIYLMRIVRGLFSELLFLFSPLMFPWTTRGILPDCGLPIPSIPSPLETAEIRLRK